MIRTTLLLLAALLYTSPALAAWGENWGEMVWGSAAPSAVPSMDGLGLGLLVLVLIGLAIRGLRSRATLGLIVLASFVGAADLAEAQVTIPNTFTNGEVAEAAEVNANFTALADALDVTVPNSFANSGIADANEVNSNFEALKTAVDTFTNNMAAATTATETAFNNGYGLGLALLCILTTDNAAAEAACLATAGSAACTQAGGTWEAGSSSCSPADNAAAEAAAAATAGSAACTQAGGTWEAGTSTCTPAPYTPSSYNCFVGGFCALAAIDYPPNDPTFMYTNVYDGHARNIQPALGAGCNTEPGKTWMWEDGTALPYPISFCWACPPPPSTCPPCLYRDLTFTCSN